MTAETSHHKGKVGTSYDLIVTAKEAGGLLTDIPRLWACDNLVE